MTDHILVIEDEENRRLDIIQALEESEDRIEDVTVDDGIWPHETDLEQWVMEQIEANHPLTLLDLELSRLPRTLPSEGFLERLYQHGSPCLLYTCRRDRALFEHQGKAVRGSKYIVLTKGNDKQKVSKMAWSLLADFGILQATAESLGDDITHARLANEILQVEILGKQLDDTPWFETLRDYEKDLQGKNLDPELRKRIIQLDVAYWLKNLATHFPGVLAHDRALAAYLGISQADLEKVAELLGDRQYEGPFRNGDRFWCMPSFVHDFGAPGEESSTAFRAWLAIHHPTVEVADESAGFWCPIMNRVISPTEAQELTIAPNDAALTRTTALVVAKLKITDNP